MNWLARGVKLIFITAESEDRIYWDFDRSSIDCST